MKRYGIFRVLLTALATIFTQLALANPLKIEHIANAGVMITSGDRVVLIDAISADNKYYNTTSEKDFQLMLASRAEVVLATHGDSDHYSAQRVAEFLNQSPATLFISTPQAVESLATTVSKDQIETAYLSGIETKQFTHKDISITAIHFPHVGAKPEVDKFSNYAYLVSINGWNLLHVGDAHIDLDRIDRLELAKLNIDVTLLPAWVPEGEGGIELVKSLNLGKVVFVHLMDKELGTYSRLIEENLPRASILATGYENVSLVKAVN